MPTTPRKARILLKLGKAKVANRTPFTIQLTIATGETKQPISLGVDAGIYAGDAGPSRRSHKTAKSDARRNGGVLTYCGIAQEPTPQLTT
jgi:hypothetical protein